MIKYKILSISTNKLKHCKMPMEEYIKDNIEDRIVEWVVDIDNGYITLEKPSGATEKVKLEDWSQYQSFYTGLEAEWLDTTIEGFEFKLNNLGQDGYKLSFIENDTYIFIKE